MESILIYWKINRMKLLVQNSASEIIIRPAHIYEHSWLQSCALSLNFLENICIILVSCGKPTYSRTKREVLINLNADNLSNFQ